MSSYRKSTYRTPRLPDVQLTKHPDYQTCRSPNVQITINPVTERLFSTGWVGLGERHRNGSEFRIDHALFVTLYCPVTGCLVTGRLVIWTMYCPVTGRLVTGCLVTWTFGYLDVWQSGPLVTGRTVSGHFVTGLSVIGRFVGGLGSGLNQANNTLYM
jgi:hypothetical protein